MNEQNRRAEEARRASKQFLQALSAGQVSPLDRFQNPIRMGDKVLYKTPYDLIFTVQAITPVLNPNVPPGLMDVILTVTVPLRVAANQPNPNAVIVQQQEQTQASGPVSLPTSDPEGDAEPSVDPLPDVPPAPSIVLVDK